MIQLELNHDIGPVLRQDPLANSEIQVSNTPAALRPGPPRQNPAPKMEAERSQPARRRARTRLGMRTAFLSLLSSSPTAMAACVSLQGSTKCPAFQSSSVSTSSFLVGLLYVSGLGTCSLSLDAMRRDILSLLYLLGVQDDADVYLP